MTQHWASCSIVVCSLLALPPILSASPAHRTGDPCKQLQRGLDQQVDDAKDRQQDDLANCRLAHGRKSDECRGLKQQQKQELRDLRADRAGQMTGCKNGLIWNTRTGLPEATNDRYAAQNDQYAQENDYYKHHHHHHHHHPYSQDGSKPASAVAGKTDRPPDKNTNKEAARTEHSAASQTSGHSTSHGGASVSAQSSSGHSGSASSGSSYSGGGHSGGGGGSSYSASSSSGGSSHSSGGGASYSRSSNSGSSYSGGSASSAPAASQSTSGGHPK